MIIRRSCAGKKMNYRVPVVRLSWPGGGVPVALVDLANCANCMAPFPSHLICRWHQRLVIAGQPFLRHAMHGQLALACLPVRYTLTAGFSRKSGAQPYGRPVHGSKNTLCFSPLPISLSRFARGPYPDRSPSPHLTPGSYADPPGSPQRPSETFSFHPINRPTHSPPRYPVTPVRASQPPVLPTDHCLPGVPVP